MRHLILGQEGACFSSKSPTHWYFLEIRRLQVWGGGSHSDHTDSLGAGRLGHWRAQPETGCLPAHICLLVCLQEALPFHGTFLKSSGQRLKPIKVIQPPSALALRPASAPSGRRGLSPCLPIYLQVAAVYSILSLDKYRSGEIQEGCYLKARKARAHQS